MIDRHDKNCRHNSDRRCTCGVADGDPHWLDKKVYVCSCLHIAFEGCKHHKTFNHRLDKFFKEALPDYTVVLYPKDEDYEPHKVKVWGQGIRYDEDESVCVRMYPKGDETWQDCFKASLKRLEASYREEINQIEVENNPALLDKLDTLTLSVKEMLKSAHQTVPNASNDLQNAYPLLFKTDLTI